MTRTLSSVEIWATRKNIDLAHKEFDDRPKKITPEEVWDVAKKYWDTLAEFEAAFARDVLFPATNLSRLEYVQRSSQDILEIWL